MSQNESETIILVPVDTSDPGEQSAALIDLLSPHSVVILGYYPVPDQSASEQLRSQFGEEAESELVDITDRFAEAGADTESVLVFTKDRSKSIDRVAEEYAVDAVLTIEPLGETLEDILVPIRGDENLDQILDFLGTLLCESEANATIFNVAETDDEASQGELIVRGAIDRLEERGIDPDRVDWQQERDDSPAATIIEAAERFDLLVVGESEPSLTERILGKVTNRILDESPRPVLIVRNRSD